MTVMLAIFAVVIGAVALAPTRRISQLRQWRRGSSTSEARQGLPTLVDSLGSAVRGGLSTPQAFAEIAATLPKALAPATRRVASRLYLGDAPSEALAELTTVLTHAEVAPLAVVLTAFHRTGGPVGESLERTAALLRGRLALEGERAALTAQGRASALVLVTLAPAGAIFFSFAMPDYIGTVMRDGVGLLLIAVVFELVGSIWLWRIVRSQAHRGDLAAFLDALIVGLGAGMTFERALSMFIERAPTIAPSSEAKRLLADLHLGRGLTDSLARFAVGADEARVAALIATSSRFGSPLARLLVTQAEALRASDRQRAEAAARRLPVLMLFPLAFCILPALLIVFLGPPLISLLR